MSQIQSYFTNPKDEPLRDPDRAFGDLDESRYRAELELVDRYQSFVAELLRLSLLGIAVFGYLYKITFENYGNIGLPSAVPGALGVLMFGVSAAAALAFRYFANEGARFYIQALRSTPTKADCTQGQRTAEQEQLAEESLETRFKKIEICRWSKAIASLGLALGGALEAVAVMLLVFGLA